MIPQCIKNKQLENRITELEKFSRTVAIVNTNNLGSVERNECLQYGKIVIFYFTATTKIKLEKTAELFSGLPVPLTNIRANGIDTNSNIPIRFGISQTGQILNQYSLAIDAGHTIEGQIVYISK